MRSTRPGMRNDRLIAPAPSLVPGEVHVAYVGKMRPQLRHVPLQHRAQTVVLHPCEPRRRIDLRPEIDSEEAVALEPPRSHQDEDAESGIGKAEVGWLLLAMHADQEVDLIDGLVNGGEFALPIGIGCELRKALRHPHAEMAAKCAVARHSALAIAQHVDRRYIDEDVILLV